MKVLKTDIEYVILKTEVFVPRFLLYKGKTFNSKF